MKKLASHTFLASLLFAVAVGCSPAVTNEVNSAPAELAGPKHPERLFQLDDLKKTTAKLGGKTLDLWIMDTDSKRHEGMMFVADKDYSENQGMVFAFKDVQEFKKGGFWMKNTISALDIIYFDKDRKLINVGKGEPLNETSVPANADFKYVVELKLGTAEKMGLKPGDVVSFDKPVVGQD